MKIKKLQDADPKTLAVIFETGDEAMAGLTRAAKEHGLAGSQITAVGAFSSATLGYFDWESKEYKQIPVEEQVEVLSLVGDVALDEKGDPKIHVHVVVGRADGTTRGGHLMEGHVRPTLEVIVVESPEQLRRRYDPESGLALIEI
ncbi:MAG TPA: PPC domain-containing DNA-binding protein [Thermomicrobiales bacterium]|jgi:predicted DNA-binding protein with PD1-like motif